MEKIGIIGTGKMGEALIKAMSSGKFKLFCFEKNTGRMEQIAKSYNINKTKSVKELEEKSNIIIIAIKPQDVFNAVSEISATDKLIISIAAGIKITALEISMPHARIVRVMPNTPCLISEMAAGYSFSSKCRQHDKNIVRAILSSAGIAVPVKEELMDAVTGLSGSGPAFVARLIEYFIDAGVSQGLTYDEAKVLTLQTFLGTTKLLQETILSPKELVDMVSSPNGTTVAGRNILESSDIKEIIEKTVAKAVARSIELGKTK
ncbi:MAG: pyrroline-5-carboxylate reductase [archaeon]